MNTTKSILRIAVLMALTAIGLCLIFDPEKSDLPLALYCIKVLFWKATGIACFVVIFLLYSKWCHSDKWLSKYEQWHKEAEQTEL